MAMQCATHWDGLAHVSYGAGPDGGGSTTAYPACRRSPTAAPATSASIWSAPWCRGDPPRRRPGQGRRGARARLPDHPGGPRRRLRARRGSTVEAGDVVLVRTGQMVHLALPGRPGSRGAEPVRDLVAYTWPMPG